MPVQGSVILSHILPRVSVGNTISIIFLLLAFHLLQLVLLKLGLKHHSPQKIFKIQCSSLVVKVLILHALKSIFTSWLLHFPTAPCLWPGKAVKHMEKHSCGQPEKISWLLALDQLSSGWCGHVVSEPADGRFFLVFLPSLNLTFQQKQINISKKKSMVSLLANLTQELSRSNSTECYQCFSIIKFCFTIVNQWLLVLAHCSWPCGARRTESCLWGPSISLSG